MRITMILVALVFSSSAIASEPYERPRPQPQPQKQAQLQAQAQAQKQAQLQAQAQLQVRKASAAAKAAAASKSAAKSASLAAVKTGDTSASLTTGSSDFEAAAIAPNPSAPPPSAQCRYGWSVTGAVVDFGVGLAGSDWDEICGLWLAAQQTEGGAKAEAASAAFCLTMKKAKVASPTCAMWDKGQGELRVQMNQNQAAVVFGGAGTSAVVVRSGPDS